MTNKRYGKLTIFLGAVRGVGKTYTMLKKAYEVSQQGTDIVVGWLEANQKSEIKKIISKLPSIPPAKLEHRGRVVKEMDISALLKLNPRAVVIDNLAHTNVPGSYHMYRYQDVEELLQAGIDVLTTLNIQNLESLNDVVFQITGIKIQETVPDRLLEIADQIYLVDIPAEELIQRVEEGKIDAIDKESSRLFRPGNINALRELTFRYIAQNLDKKVNSYMEVHNIRGPWPAGEKIMACVGPSPFSAQVIRAARRMASGLKAELIVASVETPHNSPRGEEEQEQLTRNLRLAENLGAETIVLTGNDVADELLALARRKNVTQIVIGKPIHSRWHNFWRGSIVNKVIKGSDGISVHVIPGKTKKTDLNIRSNTYHERKLKPWTYVGTLSFIILITLINKILEPSFDLINIALLYLLPVLFSATYWGRGPSIMASLVGVLAFDVFFVPPQYSITVSDLRYILSFIIFLLVANITSTMATRLKKQVELARQRETRTAALYALSRKIVAETDISGVLNTVVRVIAETVDAEVVFFLTDKKGNLEISNSTHFSLGKFYDNVQERQIVEWVFEHGQPAGRETDTFYWSEYLYLPLRSEEKNMGVLGVKSRSSDKHLPPQQRRLLEAFANLTAVALERFQLAEEAQQARYLAQSEKLRVALFNSISHEVRTPLASILGAVTSLLDEGEIYNKEDKRVLLQTINESALRMDRLVKNLLDMARLESGKLQLKLEWCDIQEVLGVALRRVRKSLEDHDLEIKVEEEIPLVRADFALLEQVLINLIDNAIKYSPAGSKILIELKKINEGICFKIADRGPKIPERDRTRIFDKFCRLTYSKKKTDGTGLGLSICKGIIEAHGGEIWVEDNPIGGNIFSFTLPLNEVQPSQISTNKAGDEE